MKPFTIPPSVVAATIREPLNLALYGLPGVGKTPLCATLPNHGYIDTHTGSYHVACRRADILEIAHTQSAEPYEVFIETCKQFRDAKVQFLVVDAVGELTDWAEAKATDYYKSLPIAKNWEGQSVLELPGQKGSPGWGYVWREFDALLLATKSAFHRTLFVGHVRDKMLTTGDGAKGEAVVLSNDIDLVGKMRAKFCSAMCAVGYVYRDPMSLPEKPIVKVSFWSKDSFAKCRCKHLYNKTITFDNPASLTNWAYIYPDTLYDYLTPTQHADMKKVYTDWKNPEERAALLKAA